MSVITMSQFGKHGRFANQLFQYAFLKTYSRAYGAELQLPPWVGNTLFQTEDPPLTVHLPPYNEPHTGANWSNPQPPKSNELVNHDFLGYAQYHTSYYARHKEFIRGLFKLAPALRERLASIPGCLQAFGKTIVGIHLRRGDYGRQIFYITPVKWYLNKLAELWPTLNDPVLFIATEDRSLVEEFSDYDPLTTDDLGIRLNAEELPNYEYLDHDLAVRDPWQLDFFPDFHALSLCDHLLLPNSTFGFFPAMLNPMLQTCWRSNLATQSFQKIDPWNTTPLTSDTAEDWQHIEGVCLNHNPYW